MASLVILKVLGMVMSLRVPVEAEVQGIDIAEHGEAYLTAVTSVIHGPAHALGDSVVIRASDLARLSRPVGVEGP